MSTPAAAGRSRRVDAQANRDRILDVAEEVFGTGGESASTEEVARRAGVGIGTVFRHFPTKAALLEAVLVRRLDRMREQTEALLGAVTRGEAGPGEALRTLFGQLAVYAAAKRAIFEALADAGGTRDGDVARASDELNRAVGSLLRKAQQDGVIRDDVAVREVYALLVGASWAAARGRFNEQGRAKLLALAFDSLTPRLTLTGRAGGAGSPAHTA